MFEKYCFLHNVKTFGPNNKAIKVSCGDNYTLVLSGSFIPAQMFKKLFIEKNLYSFGKSSHYRLGHPNIPSGQNLYQPKAIEALRDQKIAQISAGCRHAACVTRKNFFILVR